jgi:hypothetical protein
MKKYLFALVALFFFSGALFAHASMLSPRFFWLMAKYLQPPVASPSVPYDTTSYSTPGTYTFTVPSGVTSIGVNVFGAGSGGQGGGDPDTSTYGAIGSHGNDSSIANGATVLAKAAGGQLSDDVYRGLYKSKSMDKGLGGAGGLDSYGSTGTYAGQAGTAGSHINGWIAVSAGDSITVTVGAGGAGGAGINGGATGSTGSSGYVRIEWGTTSGYPSSWSEDWTSGILNLNNWEKFAGTESYSLNPDDGLMGSGFIRGNITTTAAFGLLSNAYFVPGVPCTISTKVRLHSALTPSTTERLWLGMNFYTSEGEYGGVGLVDSSITYPQDWKTYWSGSGSGGDFSTTAFSYDTVYGIEVTYDGSTTLKFYLNGTLLKTDTLPGAMEMPFHIWLAGVSITGTDTGYLDVGAMTVTGASNIWATASDGAFLPWSGNFANESGNESHWGMASYGGGLTAQTNYPVWTTIYDTSTKAESVYSTGAGNYKLTTFNASSPSIIPPTGKGYDTLKLWGQARSGGTLKVYLRYTSDNSLVPDTLVSGNSTGLAYGWPASYDVSAISSSTPFYLDVEGDNTGGSDSAPVILKGVSVSFK